MSKPVVTGNKDMTIAEAVRIMDEHNFGCLPIVSGDMPIGIVTERDILRKVAAKNIDLNSKVEEIMSKDIVTIPFDSEISRAISLMSENNFRRLVVVKENKVVGIITAKDIMEVLSDKNGQGKSM